jgi:cobalt-zinc-cadmium efflux system protein
MHSGHGHAAETAHVDGGLPGSFSPVEARQVRRLGLILVATSAFAGLELLGAWLARSDVLLADGVHMLLDVVALIVSVVAMHLAVRPATDRFTFGFRRIEPFAALLNGLLVLLTAGGVVGSAAHDLHSDVSPLPTVMLVVAAGALVVHGVSAWLIHDAMGHRGHDHEHGDDRVAHGHHHSLRSIWLHLVGDVLGAIVALVSAVVIRAGGSPHVDAMGSLVVGVLLALGSFRLLRDASLVLLDAAPAHVPTRALRDLVKAEPGVVEVARVLVWSLGAGHDAAAITVRGRAADAGLSARLREQVRRRFGVQFVTVEVVPDEHA